MTCEQLASDYAHLAFADGDKAKQAGRWPYLKERFAVIETDLPGFTALTLGKVEGLKRDRNHIPMAEQSAKPRTSESSV